MKLSVVILSHNVEKLLKEAIRSIYRTCINNNFQIIVIDNASTDRSVDMVKTVFPGVFVIESNENLGFAKGNNLAKNITKGDTVLFLNPDTKVEGNAIEKCLDILKTNKAIGAITCKVVLPDGRLDYSCHRGLPTPWNTFCYWSGLSKVFPNSPNFSGYTAGYLSTESSHFIDCISGTFLMIKREALERIGWWDEDYFWNGEDIELCYTLKKYGYKIWYEASEKIIHYKGSSSGLWSTTKAIIPLATKIRSAKSAARAMGIFVEKHWRELGPTPVMMLVRLGIWVLEKYRIAKINLGLKYAN